MVAFFLYLKVEIYNYLNQFQNQMGQLAVGLPGRFI